MNPDYILFAIPVFFLTIGIEMLAGYVRKKKYYSFEDAITNLNIGIGNQAVGLLGKLLILGSYQWVFDHLALFRLPADNPLVWIGTLLAFDLTYYWAHRYGHEWNVMWGAHIVHHQSQEYNLSVALRQSWFHNFLSFWMFLPLPVLGVPVDIIIVVAAFTTLYQYWIHTKAIGKLPAFLEFILNTPSHHRVHHAINPQYLDKNYGAVFIFWDRIFGTFRKEEETPVYGITSPVNSWNPVWANVHFYGEMLKAGRSLTIREKLLLPFRGPQYLGKILGQDSDPEAYRTVKKYATPVSMNMKLYVFIQFLVLTAGVFKYLMHFDELSLFYKLGCFFLILLTASNCSAIMERKPWVAYAEIFRLACAIVLLNTLYYYNYQDWFIYMLAGSAGCGLIFISWFVYRWMIVKEPLKA